MCQTLHHETILSNQGNYGSELDTPTKPKTKKRKGGDGDDEESELIHGSSDEEVDDGGDMTSVSSTPPMKPVITDRLSYSTYKPKTHLFMLFCILVQIHVKYPVYFSAETISTSHTSRGNPASISRAGGRTKGDDFIMQTSWTELQINW